MRNMFHRRVFVDSEPPMYLWTSTSAKHHLATGVLIILAELRNEQARHSTGLLSIRISDRCERPVDASLVVTLPSFPENQFRRSESTDNMLLYAGDPLYVRKLIQQIFAGQRVFAYSLSQIG